MSVAEFVAERAGGPIDADLLRRLAELPQTLLAPEENQIIAQHAVVADAWAKTGAKHSSDFVDAHASLSQIRQLAERLRAADLGEIVPPRPSERGFAAIRDLIDEDLQLYLEVNKIQDILQLPQLVRTCVSDMQYGTALDLAGLAGRLSSRYPASMTVQRVASSVADLVSTIEARLHATLRESARLPQLIRAVALLRRVPGAESGLQKLFLTSRQHFLATQWKKSLDDNGDATATLKKCVELFREHVFATVTAHSTLFESAASSSSENTFTKDNKVSHSNNNTSLLAEFVRWATAEFLDAVCDLAPQITEKSARSALWLQLAFCSHSLGRVGVAFWPMLGLLIPDILLEDEWRDAYERQQDMARQASLRI